MVRKVLVIDDQIAHVEASKVFRNRFSIQGYEYLFAKDMESAYPILADNDISLILLDIVFGRRNDGIGILEDLSKSNSELPVVMLSSQREPEVLLNCWELGAKSYIIKWPSLEELRDKISRYSREIPKKKLIGDSEPMRRLKEDISSIAGTDVTVLILGETGTGKELVYDAVYHASTRKDNPKISVNLSALNDNVLESELFGHEKGAFTGANNKRIGRFEQANGGTIFLDEIGDLSLSIQVKLLRVLQEREFERVGGNETIKVDVRVIAATNRDLKAKLKEGTFREDLYYRLNVCRLQVPPLRERKEDIPQLADHFLRQAEGHYRKGIIGFHEDVITFFKNYDWPGNVRELESAVNGAYHCAHGEKIVLADLKLFQQTPFDDNGNIIDGFDEKECSLEQYTERVSWAILKRFFSEEAARGGKVTQRRVAERVGLHPVNGVGRKIKQIKEKCPELSEEIDLVLSGKHST